MPDFNQVPLMFQAQVKGRNQLNYIDSDKQKNQEPQDSEIWVGQWIDRAYDQIPEFGADVRSRTYEFSWRFVTNSGQDPTIIRPAMGAFGLPFYPGSSMKGVFLRACKKVHPAKIELYCGNAEQPGILRFHGGYPTNDWKKQLLDITHPQQGWQVKERDTSNKPSRESGFALISLYQPIFQFGISSNDLDRTDWDEVWEIWEKALASGLGCRTSSGYGEVSFRIDDEGKEHRIPLGGQILFRGKLKGQGQASKLIDETPEFRPNIFRAAIRGHALRIFGGLVDKDTADSIVNDLFGSIKDRDTEDSQGNVGKLAMNFIPNPNSLPLFKLGGTDPYKQYIYENVQGEVVWHLVPQSAGEKLSENQHMILKRLVNQLMLFAMLLGGFGNSWRRIDHGEFYRYDYEKVIGCHWQWSGGNWAGHELYIPVLKIEKVGNFIEQVRKAACDWLSSRSITPNPNNYAHNWRESWHPNTVQVWGRMTNVVRGSEALEWLHNNPSQNKQGIKNTNLTGRISQIGRLWHRCRGDKRG